MASPDGALGEAQCCPCRTDHGERAAEALEFGEDLQEAGRSDQMHGPQGTDPPRGPSHHGVPRDPAGFRCFLFWFNSVGSSCLAPQTKLYKRPSAWPSPIHTPQRSFQDIPTGQTPATLISQGLARSFGSIRGRVVSASIRKHLVSGQRHMYEARCVKAVAVTVR